MSQNSPPTEHSPPPETLINGNVKLRRWRIQDVDALYAAANTSLPELSKWMPWATNGYSEADAKSFLDFTTNAWDTNKQYDYAILFNEKVSGSCGLMKRDDIPGGFEIGYWLATEATGHGLVTQATEVLACTAFEMGAGYVQVRHDEANTKSSAVPKRLGFACLGLQHTNVAGEQMTWQLNAPSKRGLN